MDQVLTNQKDMVQNEILWFTGNLRFVWAGMRIHQVALQAVYAPAEVEEAFNDVIKAREDRSQFINEARKSEMRLSLPRKGKPRKC